MNLPAPGLKGLSAFSVSAVLMACIGHASALDNTIATGTYRLLIGDFNGDYVADVLAQGHRDDEHAVSLSDGTVSQRWRDGFLGLTWNRDDRTLVVGDFNGDASSDLLLQAATPTALTELVHADATGEVGKAKQSIGDYYLGLRWDAAHRQLIVGDFNGDSRDDIFLQGKQAADRHGLALAEANGTFTALALEFPDSRLNLNWSAADTGIVAGDFDGNGASELLLQPNTSGNVLRIGNRNGLLDEIVQSLTPDAFGIDWHRADHQLVVGDFNGDGSDDVFLLAARADDGSALVTGGPSGLSGITERIDSIAGRDHVSQILVGDFDADGIDDLVLLFDTPELTPLALLRSSANARALDAALRQLGLLKDGQALRALEGHHSETHSTTTDGTTTSGSFTTSDTAQGFSTRNTFATTESLSAFSSDSGVQTMMASAGTPPTANAVGALAGSGGVTGGAANYSIPVVAPPGRNGIQPNVALSYSSRSGNGVVGIGWSLSTGQSSIHRCANTVAQEGFSRSAVYDSTLDKLCLDGQRLTKISGTYGASGAVYRTELESYQRITETNAISSASSSFTVEQNDGGKRYYTKAVVPVGLSQPSHWLLTKVADAYGNEMVYNYTLYSDSEWLLTSIVYTGLNGTAGNRTVQFNYEDRCDGTVCDYETSYASGGRTRLTQRLASVQTKLATTLLRTYTLGYSLSRATQRTLLQWVQECASTYCLPATTFSWDDAPVTYVFERLKANGAPQLQTKRWLHDVAPQGDFNGDGVQDWPDNYVNAEGVITGTHAARDKSCLYNYPARRLDCLQPDFNFDGITDGLQINVNTRKLEIAYTANNGSGNIGAWTATDIQMARASSSQKEGGFSDDEIRAIADFNADGWPDLLIYQVISTKPYLMLYPHSKGTTPYSTATRQTLLSLSYNCSSTPCKQTGDARTIGDMDGNGLPDLLSVSTYDLARGIALPGGRPNGINFLDVTVAGAAPTVTTRSMAALKPANDPLEANVNVADALFNYFADVNGDGLTDWLSWRDYGNSMVLRLNTGNGKTGVGFETWQDLGVASQLDTRSMVGGSNPQEPYSIEYPRLDFGLKQMDVDGDGKPELLLPGQRRVSACAYILGQGWTCDDSLYGTYPLNINVTSPINTGEVDEGLYEYDAIVFTEQANHTWTASRKNTGLIGSASQAGALDMYGKGLPDFVTTVGCRASETIDAAYAGGTYCDMDDAQLRALTGALPGVDPRGVYINRNVGSSPDNSKYRAVDMMGAVNDGLGNQQEWTYRPLSSDAYSVTGSKFHDNDRSYLPTNSASSNELYFVFASSMYVVAESKVRHHATAGEGVVSTRYRYGSAVYNASGRGFQGFRKIITESDKDVRSTSQFHQLFPLTGQLENMTVQRTSDNKTVSQTNNTVRWYGPSLPTMPASVAGLRETATFIDGKTYLPYTKTAVVTNTDLGGAAFGTTTTDTTLDGSGCPLSVKTDAVDAYVNHHRETNSTFTSTQSTHYFCRKDQEIAKAKTQELTAPYSASNNAETTRTTTFTYTAQRDLDVATREPSTPALKVVTDTDYDSYGNVSKVTVSGGTGLSTAAAHISQTAYETSGDSIGYFPDYTLNALNQKTDVLFDHASGLLTESKDLFGNRVVVGYDVFGRPASKQLIGKLSTRTVETTDYAWASASDIVAMPTAVYKATVMQTGVHPTVVTWFDASGRAIRTQSDYLLDASDSSRRTLQDTFYDAFGRVSKQSGPYFSGSTPGPCQWTEFPSYDVLDRPASKKLPNDNGCQLTISYSYSGPSTEVQVGTDSSYHVNRVKNILGQWWQTTDQGSEVAYGNDATLTTHFRYDGFGNPVLISRTPSGGAAINNTATYNVLGQKLAMTDPDRGTWLFAYDVLGQLMRQTDAKGQRTWFDYDLAGRVTARYEGLTDTKPGSPVVSATYASTCLTGNTISDLYALLCSSSKVGEVSKTFTYDAEGRSSQTLFALTAPSQAAHNFTVSQDYDSQGRPQTLSYPNHIGGGLLQIKASYRSDTGYAEQQQLAAALGGLAANTALSDANALDAFGNLTAEALGNGLDITRTFSIVTGKPTSQCVHLNANCSLLTSGNRQALDYSNYDIYGNLTRQRNELQDVTETFTYDRRQRLVQSKRDSGMGNTFPNLTQTVNYRYDQLGNLRQKDDYAAQYTYDLSTGNTPHQLKDIRDVTNSVLASFTWDSNGSLSSSTGLNARSYSYNAQLLPTSISRGSASSSFNYDDSNERYFERHVDGGTVTAIWKLGKLYEYSETTTAGVTTKKERSYLGSSAQYEFTQGQGSGLWRFFLTDRLGSIETTTDASGNVMQRSGFDPFGKPRQANWMRDNTFDGTTATQKGLYNPSTTRGYTGHDHIDSVGLIHTNGRMYDPELGKFLAVDPFITKPLNAQSLNPYSYVSNNPIMGWDPTGYSEAPTGSHIKKDSNTKLDADKVKTIDVNKTAKGKDQIVATTDDGKTYQVSGKDAANIVSTWANGGSAKQGMTAAPLANAPEVESKPAGDQESLVQQGQAAAELVSGSSAEASAVAAGCEGIRCRAETYYGYQAGLSITGECGGCVWFGVAGDTASLLYKGFDMIPGDFMANGGWGTDSMINDINAGLFPHNTDNYLSLMRGDSVKGLEGLSGANLDVALVGFEQRLVQKSLDSYRTSDQSAYQSMVSGLNGRFAFAQKYGASLGVPEISKVSAALGQAFPKGGFDFGNEAHRVRLGIQLANNRRN